MFALKYVSVHFQGIQMASGTCFLSPCSGKGPCQTFKVQGINTLLERSKQRGDEDVHDKLKATLVSQGDGASVDCHKNCYCTYTSTKEVAKTLAKKRKDDCCGSESEPPICKVRRSQVPEFQFDKHCLICGEECTPKDPKNPSRWNRVIKCETTDRPGLPPFKDVLLDACEQRNDDWGRKVEIRIKGALTDLPAADAQYHKKCYVDFMSIPVYVNLSFNTDAIDDDALKPVVDDMYANQQLRTWTTMELYDMYCGFGGHVTR